MKRKKEQNLTYPVKMFEGDYKKALKRCRDLSKEGGRRIYLSDVLRGFMNWIAQDLEKRDRVELDKMILTFGDQGNLLRRKQRESRKNEKEKEKSKESKPI